MSTPGKDLQRTTRRQCQEDFVLLRISSQSEMLARFFIDETRTLTTA